MLTYHWSCLEENQANVFYLQKSTAATITIGGRRISFVDAVHPPSSTASSTLDSETFSDIPRNTMKL